MLSLNQQIAAFEPISLAEMENVQLMDRIDTKFLITEKQLEQLLAQMPEHYRALQVNNNKLSTYHSVYFDTDKLHFYHNHHRDLGKRVKVRMRSYVQSNLHFLEVKHKNNKGLTSKKRVVIPEITELLNHEHLLFLHSQLPAHLQLTKTLTNEFNRLTLVNKHETERVTIDTGLRFNNGKVLGFGNEKLVVVEIKQEGNLKNTPFVSALKEKGLKPFGFSKYCMGLAMENPSLKQNLFKQKFLKIKKIIK